MDRLIIYFLPTILALGAITSYEDIREGKIRNKYVFSGFALGLVINVILLIFGVVNTKYMIYLLIYFLAAAILSILIWAGNLWNAGDAKLYMLYTLLIPLTTYTYTTANIPIFEILINTITPLFLFFVVTSFLKTRLKQKWQAVRSALNIKNLGRAVLVVFSLGWIVRLILAYFGIPVNFIYLVLGILLIAKIVEKVFREQMLPLLGLISILRLVIDQTYVLRYSFISTFLITLMGYIVLSTILFELAEYFTQEKRVGDLQSKDQISARDRKMLAEKGIFWAGNTGNTEKDLRTVKNHLQKKGFHKVNVYQTIPFAPFMFLGCLMTIIANGNVFIFIKTMLGW